MSTLPYHSSSVRALIARDKLQEIFQDQDIPPRTRLYSLEPQAVETVWQESLTSYLNRLGRRHQVSPRALIVQEIVPFLRTNYSSQKLAALSRFKANGINGNGQMALEWATILERLTKRSDLHGLTLRGWIDVFPTPRFLREKPAWCPLCYAEWQEQKLPLYEPLLWMIHPLMLCPKHQQPLQDQCPHCQKYQSFLKERSLPGHCTQCNTWLGSALPIEPAQEISGETRAWQTWLWQAVEELQTICRSSPLLTWESFFTNLASSLSVRGERAKFAEIVGMPEWQLGSWMRQDRRPSLERILELCYICNMTPAQVMRGDLSSIKKLIQEGKPSHEPPAQHPWRWVDRQRSLQLIQAVLDGKEEPLGYGQVAARLGYSPQTLYYCFPQECDSLTRRFRAYRRQRKEQRVARVHEEIRQAVLALHAQGVYPSMGKVGARLSDPNVWLQAEVRAIWHTLLQELGWERGHTSIL